MRRSRRKGTTQRPMLHTYFDRYSLLRRRKLIADYAWIKIDSRERYHSSRFEGIENYLLSYPHHTHPNPPQPENLLCVHPELDVLDDVKIADFGEGIHLPEDELAVGLRGNFLIHFISLALSDF